jgi:hypothetical protein
MNEIAEKTCKITSEIQVKGNVKAKTVMKPVPTILTIRNIIKNVGRGL